MVREELKSEPGLSQPSSARYSNVLGAAEWSNQPPQRCEDHTVFMNTGNVIRSLT
jgi:hypothetical protein